MRWVWSGLSLVFLVAILLQLAQMYEGMKAPSGVASPSPDHYFTVGQKKSGQRSWWSQPAAVELADSAKTSGVTFRDKWREILIAKWRR